MPEEIDLEIKGEKMKFPFKKSLDEFIPIGGDLIEGENYHHVRYYKDKEKHERWISPYNVTVREDDTSLKDRFNHLNVLASQLYRFTNPDAPETVIAGKQLMSKEIPNSESLFDHYNTVINQKENYTNNDNDSLEEEDDDDDSYQFARGCYAGFARAFMNNLYYIQNDGRLKNYLVKNFDLPGEEKVIPIDFDRCLWPVMQQFHNETPSDHKFPMTVADFEEFPCLDDANLANWDMNRLEEFSQFIRKQHSFKFEKNLTALELVLFYNLQLEEIEKDIEHPVDKKNVTELITHRHERLKQLCKDSPSFNFFLDHNRRQILQVVFYELNRFYIDNPHYLSKDQGLAEKEWENITDMIIKNYQTMLCDARDQQHLSIQEINKLKRFAIDVRQKKPYTLVAVSKLYKDNEMTLAAAEVYRTHPHHETNPRNTQPTKQPWSMPLCTQSDSSIPQRLFYHPPRRTPQKTRSLPENRMRRKGGSP